MVLLHSIHYVRKYCFQTPTNFRCYYVLSIGHPYAVTQLIKRQSKLSQLVPKKKKKKKKRKGNFIIMQMKTYMNKEIRAKHLSMKATNIAKVVEQRPNNFSCP